MKSFDQMEPQKKEEMTAVLMDSFKDDAVIDFLKLPRLLKRFVLRGHYQSFLRTHEYLVEMKDGNIIGTVLYKEVGESSSEQNDENSGEKLLNFITRGRYNKVVNYFKFMEELEKKEMPYPHIYIPYLGVHSIHKGNGIGKELLQKVIKIGEQRRVGIYLNTVDATNVEFYKKNGFTQVSEGVEPSSGIPYWTFKKEYNGFLEDTPGKVGHILDL